MPDLHERFRDVQLEVDDLWPEIRERAAHRDRDATTGLPAKRPSTWRKVAIVAAALAISAASLAFLLPLRHVGVTPTTPNGWWEPAELRGWIAYSSQGAIHVVDPAATRPTTDDRVLFTPPEGAAWPLSWSPDGAALLFVWSRPGDASDPTDLTSLNVLRDDGSVEQLTEPSHSGAITVGSFAPDGTVLASTGSPGAGIERIDPSTGERSTVVAGESGMVLWPSERRDGTIAFIHIADNGSTSVVTVTADGHERTVTPLPNSKDASGLSWSPDGTHIVLGLYTWTGALVVDVVGADGGGLHQVIDGSFPSWSPNGDRLALDRQGGGLITVDPDGSDPHPAGISPEGQGIAGNVGPWNASDP